MRVFAVVLLGLLSFAAVAPASAGSVSLTPFPFVFYTPETKLGYGGTVFAYLRGDDPDARPSLLSPVVYRTARDQTLAMLSGEAYLDDERWRLTAAVGYVKFPDTFWGLGNDTPDAAEEDFTPETTQLALKIERLVAPALYAGVSLERDDRELSEVAAGGLLDAAAVPGVADGASVRAGVSLSLDTRDATTWPSAGGRYDLWVKWAGGALGGDYDYRAATLSLCSYRAVGEASVLALQLVAEMRSDTPPFDLLPGLGGESLLRGYYAGRWRDRNMLAAQAEWRGPFWKGLGAVVFAGAGQVGRDPGDIGLGGLHAAGGFGLRVPLNKAEKLNLRADWGFGAESSGFYLSLGEAF